MISEIITDIKNYTEMQIPGLTAGEYHGEFEEGFDWNPVFPILLIEVAEFNPAVRDASGTVLKNTLKLRFYVANKDTAIELLEDVINCINGVTIGIPVENRTDEINLSLQTGECKLLGWQKSVMIYTLEVQIFA